MIINQDLFIKTAYRDVMYDIKRSMYQLLLKRKIPPGLGADNNVSLSTFECVT